MGLKDRMKGAVDKAKDMKEQRDTAMAEKRAAQEEEWKAAGILFQGKSHEEGRNATVTLYPDRIERVKEKAFTSLSRAKQDTEVTPMRAVSSVQAKKAGMLYTAVTVFASGNNIEFKFGHDEAQRFKDAIASLLLQPTPVMQQAPAAPAEPDPLDQLKKLAELKDAGVISQEDFDAKKKQLLGL